MKVKDGKHEVRPVVRILAACLVMQNTALKLSSLQCSWVECANGLRCLLPPIQCWPSQALPGYPEGLCPMLWPREQLDEGTCELWIALYRARGGPLVHF